MSSASSTSILQHADATHRFAVFYDRYGLRMLNTHRTEQLSRFRAKGPSAVAWVLGALIAIEIARIATALLSNQVTSPEPVIQASARRLRLDVNVQAVVSAHLFGVAGADPSPQDPNNAPPSSANLVLAGTIATENPKKGIAIISDGGPSKVFAVGDSVNEASLRSIYRDHVILDRGGNLESLWLPRLFAGESMAAPPRAAAAVHTEQTTQNVKHTATLLVQVMRTVASYDNADGKLRGLRAYPGRNRAMFAELGLRPGDLVTAINGQPLDDAQRSEKIMNTIQTTAAVMLTIERGGNRQDISLNIADITAKAAQDLEGEKPASADPTPPAAASAQQSDSSEAPNK
jgi:general secretion pathway protein C